LYLIQLRFINIKNISMEYSLKDKRHSYTLYMGLLVISASITIDPVFAERAPSPSF